jgi:uncharacterized hydrophobic protein (TIGR00271 family)
MPRTIEVSLSHEKTDTLIKHMRGVDGVVGLAVQRNASLDPPGDVLTIRTTNDATRTVLNVLTDLEVLDGGSILTSEPRSLISPNYQNGIERESNETIWDEMAFLLRRDTNLAANYLLLMALAGAVAAVGLWTNTLHIVVGAMVIAPGFEPLLRIPFGLIGGPNVLASRGVISTVAGYLLLVVGAALTVLMLRMVDPTASIDLTTRSWVQYWSQVTGTGVVLALIAGAAGAVVVTAQRSVLSAGVMIALALIPSMTIVGMALITGNPALASQGLIRWSVEAGAVLVASTVVLGFKHLLLHRRRAIS